jgi:chaperonin GroES
MEVKNVRPLFDRIVVKPIIEENKTASGIFIPDSAKEKPQEGVIISVGPGKKDEQMVLKAGDRVLFSKYGGTEFKCGDDVYLIMRESDVYAVIK